MRIGVIGLGEMGRAMAANLIDAGHEVTLWNRTPGRAGELVAKGAREAATPREAAAGDLAMTMVFDDDAVERVTFGDDGVLAGGAAHVLMATVSLPLVDRLVAAHREAGRGFVVAPVFGRPEAAAARKLFVMASGAADARARAKPLFEAVGQRTFDLGDDPAAAMIVKLAGNALIGSTTRTLAEGMALADGYGVARQALLDVLLGSLFDAPIVRTYGAMLAGGGEAAGASPIFAKDSGLAVAAGAARDVAMPLVAANRDLSLAALEKAKVAAG